MEHDIIFDLSKEISNHNIVKITFSNIRNKELELDKVIAKLVEIKNNIHIQFEYRYKRIIKHKNILTTDSKEINTILSELFDLSKDISVTTSEEIISIKISKKFKVSVNRKKNR